MYPEFILWQTIYYIDHITPVVWLLLFVIILYVVVKYQWLRFRDIVSKIPLIVIMTLLMWTYANFVFQSWHILPLSWSQLLSLFSISVSTLDFVGIVSGLLIATLITLSQLPKKTRTQWLYVLVLTYLSVLIPLGVMYLLWDSVIGKFNEWFFSIGSFVSQSRIAQLGGSVYPTGLLISAWSALCVWVIMYIRHVWWYRTVYLWAVLFIVGYLLVLHYQHYSRHLIVNRWWLHMDLRTHTCIAIACILLYLWYSVPTVHRFVPLIHEDTVWETG